MVKVGDTLSKAEKETVEAYKEGLDKYKYEGYRSYLDEISSDVYDDIDARTALAIGVGALLTVAVIGTAVYFGLKKNK